ncbi:endonuclease MutS2 [Aegicerativicinus sediminis]|uniref:endonuclease MutS2 n=1 Tax=Aegicerativicinus sediminis TaxID=2893202 RepID=UPI001E420761|nr:DNA mismatch repair protein MutS [Aegicerativicinus sediminis]
MGRIHQKTLQDLEFPRIVSIIQGYCLTDLGKDKVSHIIPIDKKEVLLQELQLTNEFLASLQNENRIPNHRFETISDQLRLLQIENSKIEVEGFRNLLSISETANGILKFLKKFEIYYQGLQSFSSHIPITEEPIIPIKKVIDRFGEIKDDASEDLKSIRKSITEVRSKINQSFNHALSSSSSLDFLDEIRESVMDGVRVLAVKAMYRKRVKGSIMGGSKTGSIVYIQPEATLNYTRELNNLEYDEEEEITRILKELTNTLRPYSFLFKDYQEFLTALDVLHAKAHFAKSINGILPNINNEEVLHLRDAFHPLLLLQNKKEGLKTYPQSIDLNRENRIIVISGPNAGGKSITLKTVGLLQIMFQSGILIPVHEKSTICFFKNVLSDIGDNQSIENHLSTYSYRLKQMNYFLRKCKKGCLFLIDEFGTGSDPELGGALAETFLEVFYAREAYGIITTHYSNLKVLANELPYMQNANMSFNERSLEPEYKLGIGQPGSSFTFEVAQKNGIPFNLINKAKKKIEKGKVRFDATIAKLHKERSKLERTEKSLKANELKTQSEAEKLEAINEKIQKKLESYQELYDKDQRLIFLGQKFDALSEQYFNDKKKRDLMSELFKMVQIENSKRNRAITDKERKEEKQKERAVTKEVQNKIKTIRKKKKKESLEKKVDEKPKPSLKVGDRVRLLDGKAVGSIDKIEKNKAVVNYGMFTTNVDVGQLELVEAKK